MNVNGSESEPEPEPESKPKPNSIPESETEPSPKSEPNGQKEHEKKVGVFICNCRGEVSNKIDVDSLVEFTKTQHPHGTGSYTGWCFSLLEIIHAKIAFGH